MNWKLPQAAMLVLTLALSAGSAAAHSKKEATQPADGAVLEASPEVIGMTFDMPMRVTLLSLTDQDATEHELTRTDNMQCQRRIKNLPLWRSKSRPLDVAPWGVMPSNSKHVPRRVGR